MSGFTYNTKFWYGHHVRMSDYETVKRNYETTRPLQGTRKKHGIDQRPLSVRRRVWETWHKDDEGNYGMAFRQSYKQYKENPVTKKQEVVGYNDTVQPFLMWQPNGALWFYPKWMNSYTTWEMLSALLPEGIKFTKYGSKQYFRVAAPDGDMYYLISGVAMNFIPYESSGKRYFMPQHGVVREAKVLVDRKLSKKYREEFNAFLDYFQPMADMLGREAESNWAKRREAEDYLTEQDWLVRKDGEQYGDKWVNAIEAFLDLETKSQHHWVPRMNEQGVQVHDHQWTHTLPTALDIRARYKGEKFYRMVHPYRKEAVPLGTPFMPNGRG